MGKQLSDRVENIVEKGEIVFKGCLLLMSQNEYLWSKGLKDCRCFLILTKLELRLI